MQLDIPDTEPGLTPPPLPRPPQPQPPPAAPRRRHGCLWAFLIVLACMVMGTILVTMLAVAGFNAAALRHPLRSQEMGEDEFPDLSEVWSCGGGETKVIVIPLKGLILFEEQDGWMGPIAGSATMALRSIRRATNDPEVRAIILDIDSPGGGITASDILYEALLQFKDRDDDRFVIALFGDIAASGAYYVAMAADHVMARPTSVTGSIGVLMQSINAHELAQKIGVRDVTIKSGENKDMLNPLAAPNEQQRALLQQVVDRMQERFVALVAEGRDLPEDEVRKLADGRIFIADQAKSLGLIDEVGYWEDALDVTASSLRVDDIKVYRYETAFSFSSIFRSAQNWDPIGAMLRHSPRTRLMYLWGGGLQ